MNKQEFMDILRTRLSNVNPLWRDEILADLDTHFQEAMAAGISEEDITAHLGDPMDLAQQFYEEAALSNQILTDTPVHTAKSGILGRRSAEKGARIIRDVADSASSDETSASKETEASQASEEEQKNQASDFGFEESAAEEFTDPFSGEDEFKHRSHRSSRPRGQFSASFSMNLGKEISRTIQEAIDSVNLSKTMQDVYDSISSVFQNLDGSSHDRTFTFGRGKKAKHSSQDMVFRTAEHIDTIYIQVQNADIMLDTSSDPETAVRYDDSLSDLMIQCEDGTLSIEQSPERAYQRGHSAAIRISLPADLCPHFEIDSKLGDIELKFPMAAGANLKSRTGNIQFLIPQCTGDLHLSSLEEILVRTEDVDGDVSLHSTNGDISAFIDTITQNLDVKDVSGDIALHLGAIAGSSKINSASGDIEIKAGQCGGDVVFYAVNGDIDVQIDSIAGSGSFRLTNGSLQAEINECVDLLAKAISGDLELTLSNPLGDLNLSATNGDIGLHLPSPLPFTLDLESRYGDVSTNLDALPQEGPQQLKASSLSGDVRVEFWEIS